MAKNISSLTFIGLSGVGKTTLSRILPDDKWFHYSVDYRLWTHYLGDELNDFLKKLAMDQPTLKKLLLKDAITLEHRVHFDNLLSTSVYMGMLGNPKLGGSTETNFRSRMAHYHDMERAAMADIPKFMERSKQLYGYPNFLIDASGSVCEVIDIDNPEDEALAAMKDTSLIVYIEASEKHIKELINRGTNDPKPIYYRNQFLDDELPDMLKHFGTNSIESLDPNEVGAYLYPKVIRARIPRYEAIARNGITITMDQAMKIKTEKQLLGLIESKL